MLDASIEMKVGNVMKYTPVLSNITFQECSLFHTDRYGKAHSCVFATLRRECAKNCLELPMWRG